MNPEPKLLIPQPPLTKAKLAYQRIAQELQGANLVLDVGGGSGFTLTEVKKCHPDPDAMFIVSMDVWMPTILEARTKYSLPHYVQADAFRIPFKSQSVDAALMIDVIEHFEQHDAIKVLHEIRRVVKHKIIVYTPTGFMPQDEEDGNPYQRHRSGWRAMDFRRMGFVVEGHGARGGVNPPPADKLDLSLALFAVKRFS
ncbi:MAG: methyltransferase domain-containing protein [bacterium]|nr:methyltransferase domain-containing protein [bacterium]